MIVHSVTGFILRFMLGGVVDAQRRGVLTPDVQLYLDLILRWCELPGEY